MPTMQEMLEAICTASMEIQREPRPPEDRKKVRAALNKIKQCGKDLNAMMVFLSYDNAEEARLDGAYRKSADQPLDYQEADPEGCTQAQVAAGRRIAKQWERGRVLFDA